MDELEEKLNSILGNPEMMGKIMSMASAFGSQEGQTDDPVSYVRAFLKDSQTELSVEAQTDGSTVVYAVADGLTQKFTFTPI